MWKWMMLMLAHLCVCVCVWLLVPLHPPSLTPNSNFEDHRLKPRCASLTLVNPKYFLTREIISLKSEKSLLVGRINVESDRERQMSNRL